MSYIPDVSTQRNRGQLMSFQQGSLLLGTSLGPAIGGFIADVLGLRWPFFVVAIVSATAALWIVTRLPEPRKKRSENFTAEGPTQRAPRQSFWHFCVMGKPSANPTFVLLSLFTTIVLLACLGSCQSILPLLAVEKGGMSATQLGLLFTFMTIINLRLVLPACELTDRFGRKAVIMPGALYSVAGLSIFAWATNSGLFLTGAALLGIGTRLIGPTPVAYSGDLAPAGKTGVTMGLYRTVGDIGLIIGPILLDSVADSFEDRLAQISRKGIAIQLNATLILLVAILLVHLGKKTAGRRTASAKDPES